MKKFFSTTSLAVTILVLLAIMIGLQQFNFGESNFVFNPKSLAAIGFIILAAFTMGEFFRAIKIPSLLGYIAAGILFGPNLIGMLDFDMPELFSMQTINDLGLVNVLTVGVIGTMGGGELQIQDIKGNVKTIFLVIFLLVALAVPATAGSVLLIAEYVPSLVPFLQDTTKESVIAAALLMGVFAVAMSPAATLAILQETKAKGKFTSLVLGIVVVADIILVLAFLLVFNFDKILLAPGGFEMDKLVEALPGIGAEFGYALLIGIVTGIIYILYMKFVARELMFFTVAVIFAASYASTLLHAETLMAFLTAGFIVQNFSKHGHDMIHSLEKISLPVFVIYFMTQAAQLDLQAVFGFLGITAILTLVRAAAFYSGTKIATSWSGANENVKDYLWLCFFSRGGVDLVLAAMAANAIQPWGQDFQTVVMAIVVVHIVAGPPLLKLGLDWAGETESAIESNTAAAAQFVTTDEATLDQATPSFPTPALQDRFLQAHMLHLREFLTDLHQKQIAKKIESQSQSLQKFHTRLQKSYTHALDNLTDALESTNYSNAPEDIQARLKRITKIEASYRQSLASLIKDIQSQPSTAIDEFTASNILAQIRQTERFSSSFRIINDDNVYLAKKDDASWVRFLKIFRRMQNTITGAPGYRRIPLGRLWRFYVELQVPRALRNAAEKSSEKNKEFWYLLGEQFRLIDRTFDSIIAILNYDETLASLSLTSTPNADNANNSDHSHADTPDTSPNASTNIDQNLLHSQPQPVVLDAFEALTIFREKIDIKQQKIAHQLKKWTTTALALYSLSLQKPFEDLLNATYKAGTLELPAFFYRPSLRFDASRTAEKMLIEILRNEENYANGQKGWIVTEEQLLNFDTWFQTYILRLTKKIETTTNEPVQSLFDNIEKKIHALPPEIITYQNAHQALDTESFADNQDPPSIETPAQHPSDSNQFDVVIEAEKPEPVPELPPPKIDWETWCQEQVQQKIDQLRNTLDYLNQSFTDATPLSRYSRALEVRVERLAPSLQILNYDPSQEDFVPNTFRFSPQEWFVQELETAVKLRFSEMSERIRSILQLSLNALDDFDQFVSLNFIGLDDLRDDEHPDYAQINANALEAAQRGEKMAHELKVSHAKHVQELQRWVHTQLLDIFANASKPIQKRQTRRLRSTLGHTTKTEKRGSSFRERFSLKRNHRFNPFHIPMHHRLRSKLFHFMHSPQETATLNDIRQFLRPTSGSAIVHRGSVPDIYRRLFSPGPLNINGFYIPRHINHHDILAAIDSWQHTPLKSTVLIHADRGFGKASLIRHIINVPSVDHFQKLHVRLREDLHSIDDFMVDLLSTAADDTGSQSIETTAIRNIDPTHQSRLERYPTPFNDLNAAAKEIRKIAKKPTIIVIENADKFFSRTEHGLQLCQQFLQLIHATKSQVLWITLFNSSAVQWLETALEFKSYFTHTIHLEPFYPAEIKKLIQRRQPISGFKHIIKTEPTTFIDWIIKPIETLNIVRNPEERYFQELSKLANGSPLLALKYWLLCVELNPNNDSEVLVHPIHIKDIDLTEPLSQHKRTILATIILHGSITVSTLQEILLQPRQALLVELHQLKTLGFIESITGTSEDCIRLNAFAEALVTPSLRQRHLL